MSRPLVMAWSGWLLVSWAINLALDGPVNVTHDTMLPAVRWLLMSAIVGIALIWPVCRLTQSDVRYPAVRAISDLIVLLLVFQVVLWPLRILVEWSTAQTMTINLAIAAWSMPIALWVYAGLRSGRLGRTIAMGLCVATLIGPAIVRLMFNTASPGAWTVLEMVWFVSDPQNAMEISKVSMALSVVCGVSVVAWAVALLRAASMGSSRPTDDASSPSVGYHGNTSRDWNI